MSKKTNEQLLPEKGIVFLGGHPNMVKKIRQYYPKWRYVCDDRLAQHTNVNENVVFFWSNHTSHKMSKFVQKHASDSTEVIYVTATNVRLLIEQMSELYAACEHKSA